MASWERIAKRSEAALDALRLKVIVAKQMIRDLRDSDSHLCPCHENVDDPDGICTCHEYDAVIDQLEE